MRFNLSAPKTQNPKNQTLYCFYFLSLRASMAESAVTLDNVKAFLNSQYYDEEKWALNMKLLRAVGLFAGSILLMRNYGDLMAI